jgi:hypothetical protein
MSTERMPGFGDKTFRSMLRWYPASWRARYGDEFIAMIEDDLGSSSPTVRYRLAIARSGLSERLRDAGLVDSSDSPLDRIRSGILTVFCAFALFVISGVGFAKVSEHWDQSIHQGSRHLPAVSFNLVGSFAVACGVATAVAACVLLPGFVQFVRVGGWIAIKRRVFWALSATLATVAVGGMLVLWARHLTNHQRNAGFGWYQLLFVIVAVLFTATIAAWTATVVAAVRRMNIGLPQLKVSGVLAVLVAVGMPVMTVAAAIWWGAMATTAPWFLSGTPNGSPSSPLAAGLFGVLVVMTVASSVGAFGLFRVVRTWRLLPRA